MTKAKFLIAAALLSVSALAPSLAEARHYRHITATTGRCLTRSATSIITVPARSPAHLPIMTAPRPTTATGARPPISVRTAGGIPAFDRPLPALSGQV
jgi:hypothetical protein